MPPYNRIRDVLQVRKVSIAELARRLDVSRPALSNVVNRKAEPGLGLALKIARALDVSVESLWPEEESRAGVKKKAS